MQCPKCGVHDVIQIELRLPDETQVLFCSCHKCDTKWWDREGRSIGLDEVLALARRPRP